MKAIIEMPKGDIRRRHLNYEKSGMIDLGLIFDVIPVNDGVMPVAYGYISGTLNEEEGDEADVLVFSEQAFEVGQEVEVELIGLIRREDGDHKVLAVDGTNKRIQDWTDVPKEERKIIEEFFSYHHKITAIEGAEEAEKYVNSCREEKEV
ncbi:MAG: inorganic diphosphatase [Candidatus Moraniibacteriota bacterium]